MQGGENLKKIYICLIITIILMFALYKNVFFSKNPLKDVKKFRVYYGSVNNEIIQAMKDIDLMIIESLQFNNMQINEIKKDSDTLLIGYISVMEIGNWDHDILSKMDENDYLKVNGVRVYNEEYNNFLGDISNESYQEKLIKILEDRVISKGLDGVFIDTVDWIDYYKSDEELHKRLLDGYKEFLTKVRSRYPEVIIIQNRGFDSLYEFSSLYIDGILWENFNSYDTENSNLFLERVKKFNELKKRHDLIVFTIGYHNEDINTKFSKDMNWKFFYTDELNRYTDWRFK